MTIELITDRKIRIAIVGYGHIAKKHIKAITEHDNDFELCAVCDANPQALQAAMTEHGVDGYHNLNDLLTQSAADIVALCTPSGLHAEQTIACAKHKKHVICEKPMATTWADGQAMMAACQDNHVELFVVKQIRAMPTIQLLKQAIDKGRFGKLFQINTNVFWTRPQDYYSASPWRGTWQYDGGALMNQASHYVDLLHWLFGPVQSIHAFGATQARAIEAEDSAVLNLRWRHGALGSMNVSMLTYPKNLEASLTVLGETGTVKIGGVSINQIEQWQFADTQPEDELIEQASEQATNAVGFGHPFYYRNIVDVMRGQASALTTGREGLYSLELLIAAYRSARDGVVVNLPLEL